MSIAGFIKRITERLFGLLKIKNIILFESIPDYSGNTKRVFDEMVRRGVNDNYKFIWCCNDKNAFKPLNAELSGIKNFKAVYRDNKFNKFYYSEVAEMIIVENMFLESRKKEQKYFFLNHGASFKSCYGRYELPEYCRDARVITLSDFLKKYDCCDCGFNSNYTYPLGFPRNDVLFQNPLNLHTLFKGEFEKTIYWLPTYRQHKDYSYDKHSDIPFPIIYNLDIAERINDKAKENNILIIVKPHPVQDVSIIKDYKLSNIEFIDNDFITENSIEAYELLGSVDALLTDYSSVYYDFLLCDKPVGFCWDDFDEYKERVGFVKGLDIDYICSAGVKIYNAEDLCSFIDDVARDNDSLKDERDKIRNIIHNHVDNQSTKRVVDYIEKYLAE